MLHTRGNSHRNLFVIKKTVPDFRKKKKTQTENDAHRRAEQREKKNSISGLIHNVECLYCLAMHKDCQEKRRLSIKS